ncbi:MAG: hypothetical protein JWO97_2970, partial [Acidobacteria bacterium]|nr:hypothetical protein [Acidobacteriota bacterium]
ELFGAKQLGRARAIEGSLDVAAVLPQNVVQQQLNVLVVIDYECRAFLHTSLRRGANAENVSILFFA